MRSALALFILVSVLLAGTAKPGSAATEPATTVAVPPAGLTGAETQQLLSVLQNPQKRQQLITTLENLQKIMPATGTAAPAPAPAKTVVAKAAVALKPNSLGADIVTGAGTLITQVDGSLITTVTSVTDYRELGEWAQDVGRDPTILSAVLDALWRLVAVLAVAFIVEFVAWRLTRRFYDRLGQDSRKAEAEAAADEANQLPPEAEAEAVPAVAVSDALTPEDAASAAPGRGRSTAPGRARPAAPETAAERLAAGQATALHPARNGARRRGAARLPGHGHAAAGHSDRR